MKFELKTISTKKFLLIGLLGIPLIMFFIIGLMVLTSKEWIAFLIIPLLGFIIYLGQRLSRIDTNIDLSQSDYLKINNREIAYQSVIGYFVNESGLTQTELCLRLETNETVQITGSSVGTQGKAFQKAQNEIIRKLETKNNQLLELEYQDVYVRQSNILRPLIYALIVIVVIIDIVAAYFLITGKTDLPWQTFFINGLLIGLIPYIKKRKKTNANNG